MNLEDKLVEIEERFSAVPHDRSAFGEELCRLHEMSRDEYQEFLERRSQTEFGKIWSRYRNIMLQLADEYLTCSDDRRKEIRQRIAGLHRVKVRAIVLGKEQVWLVRSDRDLSTLRRIVAFVSIADRADAFSNREFLSDLYYFARNAKMDLLPILKEIAELSSDVPPGDRTVSTRKYFREFQPWSRS